MSHSTPKVTVTTALNNSYEVSWINYPGQASLIIKPISLRLDNNKLGKMDFLLESFM